MKMRLISYRKNEKFKWKYCLKWKKVHLFRSNKIFDWITITTQEKTMEIREYMKWSNGNMKFDYFSCFFFRFCWSFIWEFCFSLDFWLILPIIFFFYSFVILSRSGDCLIVFSWNAKNHDDDDGVVFCSHLSAL